MKRLERKNTNTLDWWEKYYRNEIDDRQPSKRRTEEDYRFLIPLLENKGTLLDVGCGFGWGSTLIKKARKNLEVYGCDIASSAIDFCQQNYKDIEFHKFDIVEKDLSSEFDYICLLEILEHLTDPFPIIEKCLKKAKKKLFISVPYRPSGTDFEYTHINIFDIDDFRSRYDISLVKIDKHLKMMIDTGWNEKRWTKIPGWCHLEEGEFLEKLAKVSPFGAAVEIGSYKGKSSIRIGRARSVICVDNFETGSFNAEKQGKVEGDFLNEFKRNVCGYPCCPTNSDHKEYLENSKQVAFVFVDGSHYYENAKTDIFGWYEKLVTNGILAVHDSGHPEVKKAINEFRAKLKPKYLGAVRSLTAYRKI